MTGTFDRANGLAEPAPVAIAALAGVGLGLGLGLGLNSFVSPHPGYGLVWVAGVMLAAAGALALVRRPDRALARPEHDPGQVREVLAAMLDCCGDTVLRLDARGGVVADLGAEYGHAAQFDLPPVGRPLADMFAGNDAPGLDLPGSDPDGQPGRRVILADTAGSRKYAVQIVPMGAGFLALLREVAGYGPTDQPVGPGVALDALTGLPNRQAFLGALDACCHSGGPGCVALFDIDQLRAMNERYGEAVGDSVLLAFAADAGVLVRAGDTLSRIGGGAFAIILPGADVIQAEKVASRLLQRFGADARALDNAIVRATASAGISPWHNTAAETIRQAERAMLSAKARGRNRVEVVGAAPRPAAARW